MKNIKRFFGAALFAVASFAVAQISQPVGPAGRPLSFTAHGVLLGQGTNNATAVAPGAAGLCLISNGASADPSYQSCSTGSGTVTQFNFTNGSGFSGSVTNATTTPTLALTTSVSGMLKGSAGALTAATSGTDYSAGTSALGTGILKSTTGTGALTIAVAGDFPTLNQNTTGTASNVTGTVAVANGGTGLTATPTNGQIDIGNGSGFTRTTISAGSGISVTNGAGSITISASGGTSGLVLLTSFTPTASANADALTAFSSTYDNYLIIGEGIKPAADDSLQMQFAKTGVADTGSNYVTAGGFTNNNYGAAATQIAFTNAGVLAAGPGVSFRIEMENMNSATANKGCRITANYQSTATPTYSASGIMCMYLAANAATGVRFKWASGSNFVATGVIKIYGYNN